MGFIDVDDIPPCSGDRMPLQSGMLARSFWRAPRPGGDEELVGIGDRAEPFLPVQPPGRAVRDRLHPVRADVGPAVPLREELRSTLRQVVVGLEQRREEALAQLVGGVGPERADEPRRADDRTGMAALSRVREEVEERGLLRRGGPDDSRGPYSPPGPVVGGIELDLTVLEEPWQVPLGLLDRGVDHVHHDLREVMCYRR